MFHNFHNPPVSKGSQHPYEPTLPVLESWSSDKHTGESPCTNIIKETAMATRMDLQERHATRPLIFPRPHLLHPPSTNAPTAQTRTTYTPPVRRPQWGVAAGSGSVPPTLKTPNMPMTWFYFNGSKMFAKVRSSVRLSMNGLVSNFTRTPTDGDSTFSVELNP
ncbi:hypothetical protein DFH05DRAFT_1524865 [Lentinula detonsa]|uniref:Uncharacterized protein n=1 Tax=Lentinula detonsa TaxID=2804962 RepID=A0A9W8P283_9AGAR|nr:hypothetical protein DFH05DRAFT_1524865 [Lentinula detonsa]